MEKTIIIHPGCLTQDLLVHQRQPCLTEQEVEETKRAMDLVNIAVATAKKPVGISNKSTDIPQDADVYVLAEDDTSLVAKCVTPEDNVTLLGAYRNICVRNAKKTIKEVGAKVTVSKEGTVLSY